MLAGSLRLRPEPGPDGVVALAQGEAMVVNAASVTSSDPTRPLRLEVEWGDGASGGIGCGPCRLEHVYGAAGRYPLVARVTDERAGVRSSTITVRVTVEVRSAGGPGGPANGLGTIVLRNLSDTTPLHDVYISGPLSSGPHVIARQSALTLSGLPAGEYTFRGRFLDGPVCPQLTLDVASGATVTRSFGYAPPNCTVS